MRNKLHKLMALVVVSLFTMGAWAQEQDYTSSIKNATVAENADWEGGLGHGNGGLYKTSAESFDFTQTITLPAGQYKMTVKAAYRYAGSNDTPTPEEFEYNQILADAETHLAKLYAKTASYKYETNVKNRWEGASDTNYAPGENVSTVNGKFVPNSSNAVKAWFDAGQYVNELVFNVQEEGQVKIGIAKTAKAPNGDYTNIGAWTLTRLGDAEEVVLEAGDVTDKVLKNAGFDDASSWVTEGNVDQKAMDVANWTMTATGSTWYYGAAVGYGSAATVNNAAVPATNPEGKAEGGALGISVGWSCTVQYTQKANLPAGLYTLTYKVYNANGDATQAKNLFGFKSSSEEYYGATTSFASNTWVEESTTFFLPTATNGEFSVGIGAVTGGSGSNAKLFIDGVTLTYDPDLSGVTPENPLDLTFMVGTSKEAWHGGNPVTIDGISMPESFAWDANSTGDILWQEISGIPNGTYKVELWANARLAHINPVADDGALELTYVYANNVEKTIPIYHNGGLDKNTSHVLEDVLVEGGTLRMGMMKKAPGSNWHTIQIKSLTYQGYDESDFVAFAKAELQEALAVAGAVTPTSEALTAAIASAQAVYDNATDRKEMEAAVAALRVATTLAVNTNAVAGATIETPVVTNFVVNGTFDANGVTAPWKTTTKAQNQTTASNQQGAFTGNFFENWHPSAVAGKIYQEIEHVPNGLYELSICAFVNTLDATVQHVYANADKRALAAAAPTAYMVRTIVTDNKLEIGFEQSTAIANWMGIDNVSLKYYGEVTEGFAKPLYEATKAVADSLKNLKMSPAALRVLEAELAKDVAGLDDVALLAEEEALQEAMTTAQVSIDFFATNKLAIDAMYALMESTNVYTAEAYEAYSAKAADFLAQYEAGTLTATVDNPATVHDWRADVDYDVMLLSAFGAPESDWDNLHINTWSKEGETDGSEFKVPFFEYWTGDDNSLPVDTLTATMTGLNANRLYGVEAWVRVRAKNNVNPAVADSISLSVGDGIPVDVTNGKVVGSSQFSHAVYKAYGLTDAEGKLTINFNVHHGNNISWLSFKNLKCAEVAEATPKQKQMFNNAIAEAEKHIIGFDKGEYAPYANVKALEALAAAKALSLNHVAYEVIEAVQTALDTAVWTVNAEEMDFVYNGNFAVVTEGANYPNGWTRTNAWGEMRTNVEGCSNGTAYYNQPGSLVYGNTGVYTMPLAAQSTYKLTFKYRSHEEGGNANNGVVASVLNGEDGLKEYKAEANPSMKDWKTGEVTFETGAAGNYVLTLANDKNTWLTDVALLRIPVEKVTLDKATIDFLAPDSTVQLVAMLSPDSATNKKVTWTSSDPKVATVDAKGNVTSGANGTATITATAHNGKSATCEVKVTYTVVEVTKVELDLHAIDFVSPDSIVQLAATVTPANATFKKIAWTSSNTEVATVDAEGKVTSVGNGTAIITAATANGVKDTCVVRVDFTVVEVEQVTLNMDAINFVTADSTVQLVAAIAPADALDKRITWTSSDEAVATVDAEGKVTSVADGTAYIIAAATNGKADTCVVTVAIPVPVAKVTLDKEAVELVAAGATIQLVATIAPVNATDKAITWTTSDVKVATVDAEGKVTAVANGTANIVAAAANGEADTCVVTVAIPVDVTEITLDEESVELVAAGETIQLVAIVAPANATDKTVTWTTSDAKVATVDAEGKVTAVANGTATITATAHNGKSASCVVTVAIPIEVAEITLDRDSINFVSADSTVQIVATIAPEDAEDQTITWSSSDEKVATVDAEGKVTSVANGTATITATTANGKTATCAVTVKIAEDNGIDNITFDGEVLYIYDLHGRRVLTMDKGIYIVNGKKVIK